MKRTNRILPVLALAIAAAVSMPAMARDHDRRDHDDRHDRRSEYRNDHRNDRRDDRKHDRKHDRRDDRRYDDRRYGRDRVIYNTPHRVIYRNGPPPHAYPRWSRGVRYNAHGYAPTYVVRDYRNYGLREPPRGYHWRRDDRGDFIMVAIATGLIASVIFR